MPTRRPHSTRGSRNRRNDSFPKRAARYLWGVYKRNPIAATAAVIAAITGIPGVFVSMNWLDDHTEPYYVATHGYTRDTVQTVVTPVNKVGEENQRILQSIQLDSAVGKREAADNSIKQWQFELSKASDDHLKVLAEASIKSSQDTKDALNKQIQALCKAIGQTAGVCAQ